jgi:hypothetical protein
MTPGSSQGGRPERRGISTINSKDPSGEVLVTVAAFGLTRRHLNTATQASSNASPTMISNVFVRDIMATYKIITNQ